MEINLNDVIESAYFKYIFKSRKDDGRRYMVLLLVEITLV